MIRLIRQPAVRNNGVSGLDAGADRSLGPMCSRPDRGDLAKAPFGGATAVPEVGGIGRA
jgi:hypothetical protein